MCLFSFVFTCFSLFQFSPPPPFLVHCLKGKEDFDVLNVLALAGCQLLEWGSEIQSDVCLGKETTPLHPGLLRSWWVMRSNMHMP